MTKVLIIYTGKKAENYLYNKKYIEEKRRK